MGKCDAILRGRMAVSHNPGLHWHVLLSSHHFVHELEALKQRAHEAFDLTMNLMRQDFAGDISPVTMDLQQQLVASNRIRVKAAAEILSDVRKRLAREQAAPSLLDDELCSVAMMLMMLEARGRRGLVKTLKISLLHPADVFHCAPGIGRPRAAAGDRSAEAA